MFQLFSFDVWMYLLKVNTVLISSSSSSAGGVVFGEHSSVHLHRSEAGQDHQLAVAGENQIFRWILQSRINTSDHTVLLFLFLFSSSSSSGGVCPSVDPHVLPVPCRPLLHHLVRPLPPLHRHHRRAAADSHHHGDQLDDHRGAAAHL